MIRRAAPSTLRQYLAEYATTRPMSADNVRQYGIAIDLYERWLGRPARLDELDELTVSSWLRDYGGTVSQTTVRNKRTMILALWRNAADDGYVEGPRRRIRAARVELPAPVAWTLSEVERLRAACRRLKRRHRCGLPRSTWWELAVCVAWDSGLRWGDLVRLRVDQVPPHGVCVVTQHKTRRLAMFRLAVDTLRLLADSLEVSPRSLVCPWPASGETFRAQARRLIASAGIRGGTWKWLRRGGATDVEIQRRGAGAGHLGHRPGSRVAELHYIDPVLVAEHVGIMSPRPLSG